MALRRASDTRADAERSFEQLYQHRGDVYRAALRELGNVHDAEDVTQAAFVDAYRAVLRGTRPRAPRAWLLTIAENERRRRFRTSLRRPREAQLDAAAALAAEESNDKAGALLEALATLTTEQREAFLLREITGLSYDEIAQRTESTVASVQMLLFRARKTLRDQLEPHVYGAFFPLATLLSRFEALSVTPRAAGAIGAAALAVGVSASVSTKADPPPTKPVARHVVAVAPTPKAVTAPPAKPVPAAKPAPGKRRVEPAVPVPVAAESASGAVAAVPVPQLDAGHPQPEPEPERQPEPEPKPKPKPKPKRAAPPALPLASPAVPLPSVPLPPLLETLVEPLLEGAGAADAAGATAPPLPALPLDPLPPLP